MKAREYMKSCNKRFYIEGTFNSIPDIQYEVLLVRTFFPECTSLHTFGMILIPKEELMGDNENETLRKCFKALTKAFPEFKLDLMFIAHKKGIQ
jgi:hypothetical protein